MPASHVAAPHPYSNPIPYNNPIPESCRSSPARGARSPRSRAYSPNFETAPPEAHRSTRRNIIEWCTIDHALGTGGGEKRRGKEEEAKKKMIKSSYRLRIAASAGGNASTSSPTASAQDGVVAATRLDGPATVVVGSGLPGGDALAGTVLWCETDALAQ